MAEQEKNEIVTNKKIKILKNCGRSAALIASVLAAVVGVQAQVAIYDVHLQPQKFTLYTDPYNGNQIKVGGFSGLYPVAGKPNHFYTVTDRGPAPDFVDAEANAFKTFVVPQFGPHIIQLRLEPSGKAKIEDIMPLRRPNGTEISGLPTSKPATDFPYDFNLNLLPFDEDSLDAESIPANPNPNGPFVQLELLGANYPQVYTITLP